MMYEEREKLSDDVTLIYDEEEEHFFFEHRIDTVISDGFYRTRGDAIADFNNDCIDWITTKKP